MRTVALSLTIAVGALGCAHEAGKGATTGAIESLSQKSMAETGERPAELIAGRAVEGALTHLNDPRELAMLRRVVEQATTQAGQSLTTAAVEALAINLGRMEAGSLGGSVTGLTERAGAAGARGAMRVVMPACDAEGDPGCLDRRVMELSRQAGAGFVAGVRGELSVMALVVPFLIGVGCAALVVLVVQAGRSSQRSRRAGRSPPGAAVPVPQPT
jgi:hypothetical protein